MVNIIDNRGQLLKAASTVLGQYELANLDLILDLFLTEVRHPGASPLVLLQSAAQPELRRTFSTPVDLYIWLGAFCDGLRYCKEVNPCA